MERSVASLYPDWSQHASRIRDAVKDLTADDLGLRAGPDNAPIWALAAHVAGTRVYWLCGVFAQRGADRTPFTEPLAGIGWEDDESHPRSGSELGWALESSWDVVRDCLDGWAIDALDATASRQIGGGTQVHTRASVLNRLFTHDAFHAGEISQILGVHRLPPIDLWARRATNGRSTRDHENQLPGAR
jgi:uncharacterized damage-inducible protein DinB